MEALRWLGVACAGSNPACAHTWACCVNAKTLMAQALASPPQTRCGRHSRRLQMSEAAEDDSVDEADM